MSVLQDALIKEKRGTKRERERGSVDEMCSSARKENSSKTPAMKIQVHINVGLLYHTEDIFWLQVAIRSFHAK